MRSCSTQSPSSSSSSSNSLYRNNPLPLRPLRPLLPKAQQLKAEEKTLPVHLANRGNNKPIRNRFSGCFVLICRNPQCRLRTHHQYDQRALFRASSKSTRDYPGSSRFLISTLGRGLDGLPALPVNGFNEAKIRYLFHYFCTTEESRYIAILLPPALSESEKAKAVTRKEELVRTGLSDAVYCLTMIASTQFQIHTRQGYSVQDKIFSELHGKLMTLFRTKLDNFTNDEVEDLIAVMYVVFQYHLTLDNIPPMRGHRQALIHLVEKHGGLHNMGKSISLSISLDRLLAICMGEPPALVKRPDRALILQSNLTHSPVYGAGIDVQLGNCTVDQDVVDFCNGVCRAIEILEGEKWSFNLEDQPTKFNISNIYYMYVLRNFLSEEFGHLQGDRSMSRESRAVLFAAYIVHYTTLHDCYVGPLVFFLADRLKELLQDPLRDWTGSQHVVRWMLCVLLGIPGHWKGRKWALTELTKALNLKYANLVWPTNWAAAEFQNVRLLVWSNTRMSRNVNAGFSKLEQ